MMLKFLNGNSKNFLSKLSILEKHRKKLQVNKSTVVKKIIADVKKNKNKSIIKFEKKFSKLKNLNIKNIKFTDKEISIIIKKLDNKTKKSIDLAYKRIFNFHKNQKFVKFKYKDKYKNQFAYYSSAIEKVGIYVPGGKAAYPSSVLMNCIPAIIAGVKEIYMTTPAINKKINPAVIYAAKKCKVKEIYKVGGAHAIAAFAYGTETIKKVNKIVGPGNIYVSSAKKEVFGDVGIDMIAGPSEVTVVADKFSNPDWVAADLLAQAEHDFYAQVILISKDIDLIKNVNKSLKKQIEELPKKKIIIKSIKNFGYSIYVKKNKTIANIINEIAPEHLELNLKDRHKILKKVINASSIFLGKYSPEAIGDYLAGPNHVLPTSGSAKFSSGLSVYDFLKRHSLINISKTGIERLGSSVINLAEYENLNAHANSIKIRLKKD